MCGDLVQRLVARSVAQQIAPAAQEAASPYQYALTTKSGGECVAHAIQSLTDLDSCATVLSIDGISAFDMRSRAAMLDGLHQVRGGDTALPFVLQNKDRRQRLHQCVIHHGEGRGGGGGSKAMPSCPCCAL